MLGREQVFDPASRQGLTGCGICPLKRSWLLKTSCLVSILSAIIVQINTIDFVECCGKMAAKKI